jgi:hypothetical protein
LPARFEVVEAFAVEVIGHRTAIWWRSKKHRPVLHHNSRL